MTVAKSMRPYAAGLAFAVVLSAALAGCSAAPQPTAAPAGQAAKDGVATSGPAAAAVAAAQPAGPAPSGLPEAAKARTAAGAEAFVTFYFTKLNAAWRGPRTKVLPTFALTSCKSCARYELTASDLAAKGRHYAGEVLALGTLRGQSGTKPTDATYGVEVDFRQLPVALVDRSGRTISTEEAFGGTLRFTLSYSSGWRIAEVKTLT